MDCGYGGGVTGEGSDGVTADRAQYGVERWSAFHYWINWGIVQNEMSTLRRLIDCTDCTAQQYEGYFTGMVPLTHSLSCSCGLDGSSRWCMLNVIQV